MTRPAHPHADATRETTPWHIWHAAVLEVAGVQFADYEPHRDRAGAAYREGEPVWMFAAELLHRVEYGRVHDRADREADGLRALVAGARRRS